MYGLPVAVIDFETTGVDPFKCRAVSMAIVHYSLGRGDSKVVFNETFNPEEPIPSGASAIHGIYDKDVEGRPTFWESFTRKGGIRDLLAGRVLAAYNLPYDWQVLNSELQRCRHGSYHRYSWFGICGLVLARYVDEERKSGHHKLEAVCARRDVDLSNAHDAGSDAYATSLVLGTLLRESAIKRGSRFETLRDYWAFQRIHAIQNEMELRAYFRRVGRTGGSWSWTEN